MDVASTLSCMRTHHFHAETTLPLPRDQVFPFFAAAENLETITPAELKFQILTPLPIAMDVGTLIRYRLRLMGVPFEWLTRISAWNPPHEFEDVQMKGPYRTWIHRHRFMEVTAGTRMEDDVLYALPLFPLGEIAAPLVALQVGRIFTYREQAIRRAFNLP
jgi:ligand-binding SRPBCC domain-containing protein